MDAAERDSTQDWLLPEHSTPPLLSELEGRIDEALATARASKAAVTTVGAAALNAADQARRAAQLAERASAAAVGTEERVAAMRVTTQPSFAPEDDSLRGFSERADRIVARLRELDRPPTLARTTNAAAGRPRSAR